MLLTLWKLFLLLPLCPALKTLSTIRISRYPTQPFFKSAKPIWWTCAMDNPSTITSFFWKLRSFKIPVDTNLESVVITPITFQITNIFFILPPGDAPNGGDLLATTDSIILPQSRRSPDGVFIIGEISVFFKSQNLLKNRPWSFNYTIFMKKFNLTLPTTQSIDVLPPNPPSPPNLPLILGIVFSLFRKVDKF